jgi:hypothetical protein
MIPAYMKAGDQEDISQTSAAERGTNSVYAEAWRVNTSIYPFQKQTDDTYTTLDASFIYIFKFHARRQRKGIVDAK